MAGVYDYTPVAVKLFSRANQNAASMSQINVEIGMLSQVGSREGGA